MTRTLAQPMTRDGLLDLQRRTHEIRACENVVRDWFTRALVRGRYPPLSGPGSSGGWVTPALRAGDTTTCPYRGHGTVLAHGAPQDRDVSLVACHDVAFSESLDPATDTKLARPHETGKAHRQLCQTVHRGRPPHLDDRTEPS